MFFATTSCLYGISPEPTKYGRVVNTYDLPRAPHLEPTTLNPSHDLACLPSRYLSSLAFLLSHPRDIRPSA